MINNVLVIDLELVIYSQLQVIWGAQRLDRHCQGMRKLVFSRSNVTRPKYPIFLWDIQILTDDKVYPGQSRTPILYIDKGLEIRDARPFPMYFFIRVNFPLCAPAKMFKVELEKRP